VGRLFWKIFVAFWVAMLLIAAAAALTTSHLAKAWHERAVARRELLETLADDAEIVLIEGGREGLRQWLHEVTEREGGYFYALDDDGRELLDRKLPDVLEQLRLGGHFPHPPPPRLGDSREGRMRCFARGPIAVRWIGEPGGERFRLMADLGLRSRDMLHSPIAIAVCLGVAILLSGFVSFFLARYLTSPVLHLRRTTRRFTSGDLDARVGPALGSRRDELADLGRDFDKMAERIGRMLTSQRRLLRDLSHELRSPLARLQVALELARKRAGGLADSELQRIELESERLNEMIGQILSLVRLESNPHDLERRTADLDELLGGIVEDADYEARGSDRTVRLVSAGPVQVSVNEDVLRRAVENIVRNAVRHTASGTSVEVLLTRAPAGGTSIAVRDHGPGAPESSLPHLFEAFYRDAEARGLDPAGHGIGLAIAKRAVEVHGGSIGARNHPDGGLVVEIRLPNKA